MQALSSFCPFLFPPFSCSFSSCSAFWSGPMLSSKFTLFCLLFSFQLSLDLLLLLLLNYICCYLPSIFSFNFNIFFLIILLLFFKIQFFCFRLYFFFSFPFASTTEMTTTYDFSIILFVLS